VPADHLPWRRREEADPGSILHLCRRLIGRRRTDPRLSEGDIHLLDLPDPLVAFERGGGSRNLLCLFNLGDQALATSHPGWRVIESVNGATIDHLPPLSGFIAERAP